MTLSTQIWVNRSNYRETKIVEQDLPALNDGQVLVAIDKFGLTANNVTYAVSGDVIGYWGFYPTGDEAWGKVPVWGCANVVESHCDEIPVGERLWGFFPMDSHTVLEPSNITKTRLVDAAKHRADLPALYNGYSRTNNEPELMRQMETERCLLFPLFATSYVLYDYLIDNDFFGASQVLIGSASSKTGFGLAKMLHDDAEVKVKVVGLTSKGNIDFVKSMNCCDQIVVYGNESEIDASEPAAYVDMSGDLRLKIELHELMQENMVESCMVGASHWEDFGKAGRKLPGAKPTMFFAPGQFAKRDKEWGVGVAFTKAVQESAKVAMTIKDDIDVQHYKGAEQVSQIWLDLLDNKVSPSRGIIASLI